jgi:hypothetical protein
MKIPQVVTWLTTCLLLMKKPCHSAPLRLLVLFKLGEKSLHKHIIDVQELGAGEIGATQKCTAVVRRRFHEISNWSKQSKDTDLFGVRLSNNVIHSLRIPAPSAVEPCVSVAGSEIPTWHSKPNSDFIENDDSMLSLSKYVNWNLTAVEELVMFT